jgi:ribosome-associated heat shock protein Hsp15
MKHDSMRPQAVRVDKWLWAARFFKTRSLATEAVDGGKVKLAGQRVKPAKELRIGDQLTVQIGDHEWQVTVQGLSDKRGPAELARQLYEESEESRARRQAQIDLRRVAREPAEERQGRPTKRDRRMMRRFTGDKE